MNFQLTFRSFFGVILSLSLCSCKWINENAASDPQWSAAGPGRACGEIHPSATWDMNSSHAVITKTTLDAIEEGKYFKNNKKVWDVIKADAQLIIQYANSPDVDNTDDCTFASHFYNPKTGNNYVKDIGDASIFSNKIRSILASRPVYHDITARDQFLTFMPKAFIAYKRQLQKGQIVKYKRETIKWRLIENEEVAEGPYALGFALHYLEDACNPYHVRNITAVSNINSSVKYKHVEYEAWVDKNKLKWLNSARPIVIHDTITAFNSDVDEYLHTCANTAYDLYDKIQEGEEGREIATGQVFNVMHLETVNTLVRFIEELADDIN